MPTRHQRKAASAVAVAPLGPPGCPRPGPMNAGWAAVPRDSNTTKNLMENSEVSEFPTLHQPQARLLYFHQRQSELYGDFLGINHWGRMLLVPRE